MPRTPVDLESLNTNVGILIDAIGKLSPQIATIDTQLKEHRRNCEKCHAKIDDRLAKGDGKINGFDTCIALIKKDIISIQNDIEKLQKGGYTIAEDKKKWKMVIIPVVISSIIALAGVWLNYKLTSNNLPAARPAVEKPLGGTP